MMENQAQDDTSDEGDVSIGNQEKYDEGDEGDFFYEGDEGDFFYEGDEGDEGDEDDEVYASDKKINKKISEFDELDKLDDEVNEVDEVDEADETRGAIDEVDKVEEVGKVDEVDEVDESDSVDESESDSEESDTKDTASSGNQFSAQSFDLGNLAYFSTDPMLKNVRKEAVLESIGRDATQNLIRKLFIMPSRSMQRIEGRVITLPTPITKIPREKPLPKKKELTRWEKFAKQVGIKSRKKDRYVWDETNQKWAPRYGYKKGTQESDDWVMEHTALDDLYEDPWDRLAKEKKHRGDKNKWNMDRNKLQAVRNQKGRSKIPGAIDLQSTLGPRPMLHRDKYKKPKKGKKDSARKNKKRKHVDVALKVAQRSTASMGRFDAKRYNEPGKKLGAERRDKSTGKNISAEQKISKDVMEKLFKKKGDQGATARFSVDVAANRKMSYGGGVASHKGSGKFGKRKGARKRFA